MGAEAVPEDIRNNLPNNDIVLILGVMGALYALFTFFGLVLGLGFAGVISTLQQITFLAAVYALLALALNLQWGYAGLLNIGVAGFMAVGVYTMAMLTAPVNPSAGGVPGLGLPLPVGIIGGMIAAALLGALAALPALRLKADYLAIVTLAIGEIVRVAYNSESLQTFSVLGHEMGSGASLGISTPTNPVMAVYYSEPSNPSRGETEVGEFIFGLFGGIGIDDTLVVDITYVLVLLVFVALFYGLLSRIANSPFGRVLKGIRDEELAARSLGKNTRRFKIKVFMLGCALMGLGGILWQGSQSLVTPDDFTPLLTFYIFIALIIGGDGSNTGSVIGGALFAGLLFEGPLFVSRILNQNVSFERTPNTFPEAIGGLTSLDPSPLLAYTLSEIESLRLVLFGILLIYLMYKRPQGLLGHRKEIAIGIDVDERGRPETAKQEDQPRSAAQFERPGDKGRGEE